MATKKTKKKPSLFGGILNTKGGFFLILGTIGLLMVTLSPGSLQRALTQLVNELGPLVSAGLTLGVVVIGYKIMFGRK